MAQKDPHPQFLSLGEAARTLPKTDGKTVSTNAVWRWCRKGVKSRAGDTVRLEHVRLGGRIYTTARWLTEFGRKLAEADAEHFRSSEQPLAISESPQSKAATSRYSKKRLAQIEQAERELRDMGV